MIVQIKDKKKKQEIAYKILNALPEWFGIPEALEEYVINSTNFLFWAEIEEEQALGFAVLRESSKDAAELYVMGVLPEYHRKGIGRRLFQQLYAYCQEHPYEYLQVKTVDEGYYEEYDRTRKFYESVGMKRLEVFPTLWDPWNPCLLLVMHIEQN